MTDYIKREDVLNALREHPVTKLKTAIKWLPSADAAPVRHGRWIDDAGAQKCSVCGTSFSDLHPLYEDANYCPYCGTTMDGEEDDD